MAKSGRDRSEDPTLASTGATDPKSLTTMFAPRGIAIVGASDASAWSEFTYSNLRRGGYPHPLYVVNRRGGVVHGQAAARSMSEVGEPIDLAFVLTGPKAVPGVMEDAYRAGVKNLAVIAAGFSEMGGEGREREDHLRYLAGKYGQVILGPNNVGFINNVVATRAWSSTIPWPQDVGRIGILSHSGALTIHLLRYLQRRDIPISHLVTLGNEAMLSVAEGIDYLIEQEETRVIAAYIESIRRPESFLAAADRAMQAGKPVVVYKAGRGVIGARATAAHTGSLAEDDRVMDAVFRQHGVVRVHSIEDLVATCALLDAYGELPGNRVGFVFGSGAYCAIFGDKAEENGLDLPDLSPVTVDGLRAVGLPEFATLQNPLDVTGQAVEEPEVLRGAERVMASDPNIDVLVVMSEVPLDEAGLPSMAWLDVDQRLELTRESNVPIISMEFLPGDRTSFGRDYLRDSGLPFVVESLALGITALGKAVWWSGARRKTQMPDAPKMALPIVSPSDRQGLWSERRVMSLLVANGIPSVPQELVTSGDAAASVSTALGFPVALKISSPDISHKTDVGGVIVGVDSPVAAASAYEQIVGAVSAAAPDARIEGVVVSQVRPEGVDLVVGVVRDATWGSTLVVGLGGIWVEILGDAAVRRLPVSQSQVREMLAELKSFPLLTGWRGTQPVDLDELARVITRIGDLAVTLGKDLEELEINPLRVVSGRVEALDALIRWRS